MIPQPEAASQSPPATQRRTLLVAGLVTTVVVLLGATAFAITRSDTLMGMFGGGDPPPGEVADSPEGNTPPATVQEQQTVDEGGTTTEATSPGYLSSGEVALYEEFGREYVDAIRNGDWEQAYSMLSESSQEEFTEEEWSDIQGYLQGSQEPLTSLESVTVEPDEGVTDGPVTLTLDYEDGAQDEMRVLLPMAIEAGEEHEPERVLTDEEISELRMYSPESSGETTSDSGGDVGVSPGVQEEARQAVEDYYEAVNDDDWYYTYSRLSSETQALFTENEWARRSQWFEETSPTYSTPVSVEVQQGASGEPYAEVERELTVEESGSTRITETRFVQEDGEWVQQLSGGTLDQFVPGGSFEEFVEANGGSVEGTEDTVGQEGEVEQTIQDHYLAIGDNDFEEAYSFFSSGFQSNNPQAGWIEEEESFDIQNSTINSIEVTEVGDSSAIATVDVSFEDNTGYPRFEITWGLVSEGGEWRLDEVVASKEV